VPFSRTTPDDLVRGEAAGVPKGERRELLNGMRTPTRARGQGNGAVKATVPVVLLFWKIGYVNFVYMNGSMFVAGHR